MTENRKQGLWRFRNEDKYSTSWPQGDKGSHYGSWNLDMGLKQWVKHLWPEVSKGKHLTRKVGVAGT